MGDLNLNLRVLDLIKILKIVLDLRAKWSSHHKYNDQIQKNVIVEITFRTILFQLMNDKTLPNKDFLNVVDCDTGFYVSFKDGRGF